MQYSTGATGVDFPAGHEPHDPHDLHDPYDPLMSPMIPTTPLSPVLMGLTIRSGGSIRNFSIIGMSESGRFASEHVNGPK